MTARNLLYALIATAAIAVAPSGWAADRGVQFTPSGDQVLANKNVGVERWAITLNDDDGTVTGNVFRTDGGLPSFISCTPLPGEHSFACSGADPCSEGGAQRGIQRTPDGKRTLVNKTVGTERWAIALNEADQTVTGNVFRDDGGDPAFVVCTPLAGENSFACSGADACTVEPCTDQFTSIGDVTLPSTFFELPTPCNEQFSFIANVTLPDDFFRLTTTEDFISEVETSTGVDGMLRVGAAPIPGPNPPAPIGGVSGDTSVTPGGTNDITVSLSGNGASAAVVDNIGVSTYLVIAVANETCTPGNFVSGFYEIPLFTTSGQVALSITFPTSLSAGNFVLCITLIEGGVVGQYFVFQQISAACGNGRVDAGEACDPPAAQSQCVTGQLCSNDCQQCVSATSCAGRCCPGRDDNCTADAAPCFCDEFCVTANDCCEDALSQCGFGSSAPTISSLTQSLVALNTTSCNFGSGPLGSLIVAEFNYSDPDGDVTPPDSLVEASFVFLPSGGPLPPATSEIDVLSGNGFSGMLQFPRCYRFASDTSGNLTLNIRDNAGNASNTLMVNIPKPQGAN